MSNKVIELKNLTKKFKELLVLDNINGSFEKGKVHGLIGKNGCGKTVLLKLICGFLHPSSGTVVVDNKVIGQKIDFPNNIGILIETPGFLPYYSGIKNLLFLSQIQHCICKDDISLTMEEVGLNPKLKTKVSKYSLGMLQRLAFAQAIMEKPSLLILDELFSSLDESGINVVKSKIYDLKKTGRTIIITSHNKGIINEICDNIYKLENGKLMLCNK